MKKYITSGLFIFCCLFAKSQVDSAGCARFKTGKFAYTDDSLKTFVVKRKSRIQEETEGNNIITRYKIKWLGPCSYELKQLWSNSKTKRKNNGTLTTVLITMAGDGQYTYTCDCKNIPLEKKSKGIMYLITGTR